LIRWNNDRQCQGRFKLKMGHFSRHIKVMDAG
jgi:hypothetical protein